MDNAVCNTLPHAECSPSKPHRPCLLKLIDGDVTVSYTPLGGEVRAGIAFAGTGEEFLSSKKPSLLRRCRVIAKVEDISNIPLINCCLHIG